LAIAYLKLGETHRSLGNLQKALEFFQQYNKLVKKLYEEYPQNVLFSKNSIYYLLWKQGTISNWPTYHELYDKCHTELTMYYLSILGDPKEARVMAFEALLGLMNHLDDNPHGSLGNLEKALQFYEQFSELEKQLYENYLENVSSKNGLAISYSRRGYTHWLTDNFKKALDFFEQYNKLAKQLYEEYPENVSFKSSLAISYQYLAITHSSLENLDSALPFCKQYNKLVKQLYESYPKNVQFKDNLATSCKKLGQLYNKLNNAEKAKVYVQECYDIYEELVCDFPEYVAFKKKYGIVSQILKFL